MARLGELLVATKLLTPEQLERALRAQVMWGARLGTNLIELGVLDLEVLSQALSRQHKLPAALARHFEKADHALQAKLPVELAERLAVVPLMRVRIGKVVVAAMDPLADDEIATIAGALGVETDVIVQSVAPELRIRYQLERAYKIPRGARFLRARGLTIPPFPEFDVEQLTFEDSAVTTPPHEEREQLRTLHEAAIAAEKAEAEAQAEVIELTADDIKEISAALDAVPEDDLEIEHEPAVVEPSGRERRKYVRMITDEAPAEPERPAALGRIAIRRVAVGGPPMSIAEATRAIRRGTDRDKVADLVVVMLERFVPSCDAAILLVLRGDIAVGWKGYCSGGGSLPEIAVPLAQPGLVPSAIAAGICARARTGALGPIDQLLITSLGGTGERELIVLPVTIAGQVMLTIALVAEVAAEVDNTEAIATATGAAFARLMRDASR